MLTYFYALQVGQPEEAGAELQALVANKGASAIQCLAGLTAAIAAPSCKAAVRAAAVQIIIKRGREDMTVVPYIVDILMKAAKRVSLSACKHLPRLHV